MFLPVSPARLRAPQRNPAVRELPLSVHSRIFIDSSNGGWPAHWLCQAESDSRH